MNTRICYLYRDAGNYKVQNECVVEGTFTGQQVEAILACCQDGEYFIPCQVGLPEKRFDEYDPDEDHCWFEIDRCSFLPTTDPPTVAATSQQMMEQFSQCRGNWKDSEPGISDIKTTELKL